MPKEILGDRIRLGLNAQVETADSILATNAIERLIGEDSDTYAVLERYKSAGAGAPTWTVRKANGTLLAPTTLALNDEIGGLASEGRGNTKFWDTGTVKFFVDEVVVAGNRPASRIEFANSITGGTVAPRMILYGDGQLGIGAYTGALRPDTNSEPDSLLSVVSNVNDQGIFTAIYESTAGGNGGQFRLGRARGSLSAPLAVANGDNLGEIEFFAYTGATGKWQHSGAEIQAFVDGAVVADQIPPSRMDFYTSPVNTSPIKMVSFYSNGTAVFGKDAVAAGLAYANTSAAIQAASNSITQQIVVDYSASDSSSPSILIRKSRGTLTAPAAVNQDDNLGRISTQAYSGSAYNSVSRINVYCDSAPVANQSCTTRFEIETVSANNGSSICRLAVNRLGVLCLCTNGSTSPVVSGNNYGAIQIHSTAPVSGIYLGNAVNAATNVLDWYEEGTWTPALGLGDSLDSSGFTYTSQSGTFTRIGNRIWCAFNFDINVYGSAAGTIGLKGLPYVMNTAAIQANGGEVFDYFNTVGLTSRPWLAYDTAIGNNGFRFQEFSATGLVDLPKSRFQAGTGCHGLLMYQVAT
jgi:hypothetical protein